MVIVVKKICKYYYFCMKKKYLNLIFISFFLLSCKNPSSSGKPSGMFDYVQVNEGNALKGFYPFMTSNPALPCSMEYFNVELKDIMTGENTYNFTYLNQRISEINGRGHQAVFRVVLDTPESDKKKTYVSGTPDFFWDKGIQKITYHVDEDESKPLCYFPDYQNQICIDILEGVIRKLGAEYNGNPGVGFIFCGLIGHWGEWHNTYYVRQDGEETKRMPTDTQQRQLYKAFSESFTETLCMTRYPTSSCLQDYDNIGFHDDSFTQSTVNDSISWYFYSRLKSQNVTDRWVTAPIGGEFRPEGQLPFMNGKKYEASYQDYDLCLSKTHCSNLIFNKAFNLSNLKTDAIRKRTWEASKKLGYDLYCSNAEVSTQDNKINLTIYITNKGIAPFYYNWKPEVILSKDGTSLKTWKNPFTDWDIRTVLPGETKSFTATLSINGQNLTATKLIFGIQNPVEGAVPLKFSNKTLNEEKTGYITIKEF